MGVRARRWQLWLITTFILTGMIGMIQLFKGPESVGAVQVAGAATNPSVVMPSRSVQATELPSWTPTAQPAQSSSKDVDVVRVPRTSSAAVAPAAPTSSKQETQFPTPTTPGIKITSVTAKSITPTATTAKPTTATSSATKPATTKPVTTTTQAKPVPSPVKTTSAAGPKRPGQQQPRCFRILWFTFCR